MFDRGSCNEGHGPVSNLRTARALLFPRGELQHLSLLSPHPTVQAFTCSGPTMALPQAMNRSLNSVQLALKLVMRVVRRSARRPRQRLALSPCSCLCRLRAETLALLRGRGGAGGTAPSRRRWPSAKWSPSTPSAGLNQSNHITITDEFMHKSDVHTYTHGIIHYAISLVSIKAIT